MYVEERLPMSHKVTHAQVDGSLRLNLSVLANPREEYAGSVGRLG